LRISDADNASVTANRPVVFIKTSNNNKFIRLLLHHNNRHGNNHLIESDSSDSNLYEEIELYNFHRHGILFWAGSDSNTLRRVYCNARSHGDITGGRVSGNSQGADSCLSVYPGSFNIIENLMAEGNVGQLSEQNATGTNIQNRFLGIMFNGENVGAFSTGLNPNARGSTLTRMPREITCTDCVFVNGYVGFRSASAKDIRCDNCTFISNSTTGIYLRHNGGNLGDSIYSFRGDNINILGPGSFGVVRIETGGTWTVTLNFVNIFNTTTAVSNLPSAISNLTTVNPSLGSCYTHIRPSSALSGAGLGGADLGADVTFAYVNGVKTSTKLLDSTTGELRSIFIGATVNDAGLNTTSDSPADFISSMQPSCNWSADKPTGY